MFYEIRITLRTIRQEGLGAFFKKLGIYFYNLFLGARFFFIQIPRQTTVENIVDFSFNTDGGLLMLSQVRSEIISLADLVGQHKPKVVVEIGTAHGGTLVIWCHQATPDATIISIDLPGGVHGGGYPYWKSWIYRRFPSASQKLHLLRGDSHQQEMVARLLKVLPGDGKIDFLFIDGDHTYEGVKADFQMYSKFVRPGGIIAFHDIVKHPAELDCHVDRFWQEIKNEYSSREFVHNPEQGICGIGVIELKP